MFGEVAVEAIGKIGSSRNVKNLIPLLKDNVRNPDVSDYAK